MSNVWQVQEAKARFSEMLETSLSEGPQVVTKRGVETAVLVPIEQWRRMESMAKPELKELLLGAGSAHGYADAASHGSTQTRCNPLRVVSCFCLIQTLCPNCDAQILIQQFWTGFVMCPLIDCICPRSLSGRFRPESR